MASGIGGVTTLLNNYDSCSGEGSPPGLAARRADADAERPGGQHQPLRRGAGRGEHPGLGLRVRQRGASRSAVDQIRLGRADIVLAGGTEAAIHPLPMAAFANMMALSKNTGDPTTVSRPWDTARDGFVLGEGAGVLVLESEEHARARGATIYAEVLGAGITADSHDIAQPDPAGRGGARAIVRAIQESAIEPQDIVHINAHATSTPQGDIAEGLMIHATLGSHADQVVVTSTKSMTGHLLGGAGALEAMATMLAIQAPGRRPDDQPRRPGPAGRAGHRHQGPRPARRRHRGPEQLLRLRWRQRRRRLRECVAMTATVTKPPRTEDPRHPVHRLTALFDEGSLELITPEDDSGMLAAVGRVRGRASWPSAPTPPSWVGRWATSGAGSWSTPTTAR